ncbi:MAG: nucleoside kinase [Oscillospiraceae bacterium]|jgi:uridine kinase|nr:nucleoside kinase [Oscillospiraceae bacterium]
MSNGFFDFEDIVRKTQTDPRGFMAECDHVLNGRLTRAAAKIASDIKQKRVVLLSGPSGSGKTTTANKLAEELEWIGVGAHVVSMDNYFLTVNEATHPRDHKGEIDYESPKCLDIPLLNAHFAALTSGEEVLLPYFDFARQRRDDVRAAPLRLGKDEVAVFEGIHALNPLLLGGSAESQWRVYASARANIYDNRDLIYKGTWIRLTRRLIRDAKFRGWAGDTTLRVWASVRRGEKKHISPYKDSADIVIDTALAYEIPVLRDFALPLLREVPDNADRAPEMRQIAPMLERFPPLPEAWVSRKSLLREFIGLEERVNE